MDVALVNPFIEGTLHILDTTALVKVKPEPPFLKRDTVHHGDISGLLTVEGDLEATVAISFTKKSILGIVSAMFGEEMTEINEEITDAVGEISNMVAGHVTTKIGELGKKVKVKFVRVVTGQTEEILHTEAGSHVVGIPFRTTKGKVLLEICYSDQSS
ncbi:chemotaxis protein CheX [Desulfobacter hydrogenophilus]|uniref:Chemotaxis protein CheX n=1 Tax=Desulfobacter hydrogenophilus TaxID=2291 RepID=A0A328FFW5_9BACT|nr:chemotaxis protein CheX [Desulfobacter hydrogenophilus]NDY72023.1 chemotaxis protein CheX [Desulfobacter hydrogenophilus]QBH11446.1 chemotaxis protein CheX [Desulfobacter hydrogenophilus]RAM01945.1 chemotaxis protein CheX [Desulfobacter hydrogenophilus]